MACHGVVLKGVRHCKGDCFTAMKGTAQSTHRAHPLHRGRGGLGDSRSNNKVFTWEVGIPLSSAAAEINVWHTLPCHPLRSSALELVSGFTRGGIPDPDRCHRSLLYSPVRIHALDNIAHGVRHSYLSSIFFNMYALFISSYVGVVGHTCHTVALVVVGCSIQLWLSTCCSLRLLLLRSPAFCLPQITPTEDLRRQGRHLRVENVDVISYLGLNLIVFVALLTTSAFCLPFSRHDISPKPSGSCSRSVASDAPRVTQSGRIPIVVLSSVKWPGLLSGICRALFGRTLYHTREVVVV